MPLSADGWFEDASAELLPRARSSRVYHFYPPTAEWAKALGQFEPPQPKGFTSDTPRLSRAKPQYQFVAEPLLYIDLPTLKAIWADMPHLPRTRGDKSYFIEPGQGWGFPNPMETVYLDPIQQPPPLLVRCPLKIQASPVDLFQTSEVWPAATKTLDATAPRLSRTRPTGGIVPDFDLSTVLSPVPFYVLPSPQELPRARRAKLWFSETISPFYVSNDAAYRTIDIPQYYAPRRARLNVATVQSEARPDGLPSDDRGLLPIYVSAEPAPRRKPFVDRTALAESLTYYWTILRPEAISEPWPRRKPWIARQELAYGAPPVTNAELFLSALQQAPQVPCVRRHSWLSMNNVAAQVSNIVPVQTLVIGGPYTVQAAEIFQAGAVVGVVF